MLARRRLNVDVRCCFCRRVVMLVASFSRMRSTMQQNRKCSQGVANATAVESHVEAGNAALAT